MSEDLDLSGVLSQLKRADEALTEFVAPLWPGIQLAAAWMEHGPTLFRITDVPAEEGYYLLRTDHESATVLRQAEDAEARKYLSHLPKAKVILLPRELAYPASFAERLQGITGPRPIHFAPDTPLESAQARFDSVNLFYDRVERTEADSLLGGLLSESSIFTPGELLDTPGDGSSGAEEAARELETHSENAVAARLNAILEPADATLIAWSPADGALAVTWARDITVQTAVLPSAASPITSGICLPGARHFAPGRLTRLLLDHVLDAWQE